MANATQPQSNKIEAFGSVNWYGNAPNNSNRQPVDATNFIQTQDATPGTNIISPVTVGTTPTVITIPQNAVKITLVGASAFQFSEVAAMTQFAMQPSGASVTLNVARQLYLYLNAATGTSVVSFFFSTL